MTADHSLFQFLRRTIALPFVTVGVGCYLLAAFAMHFADAISGQRWGRDLFGYDSGAGVSSRRDGRASTRVPVPASEFPYRSADKNCPICGRIFFWTGPKPLPEVCPHCVRDEMSGGLVMQKEDRS